MHRRSLRVGTPSPSQHPWRIGALAALAAASVALAPGDATAHSRGPGARPPAQPASALDRPTSAVWPAVNRWNDTMEREFGAFVHSLGQAVASHRCRRLDACLRDPTINTTYDPAVDARLNLRVDCADLPYVLRAYFAFKRRLPFGFVAYTQGRGGQRDERYSLNIRPTAFRTWRDFATPRRLLREVSGMVHSGMYRMAPEVETADFYPAAISRDGVRPGSIFYDPNGHVLVVADVRNDGAVYMVDGHPDGSLTWKRFGQAFVVGTRNLGGGFKNFRPITLGPNNTIVRAANATLPLFDGRSQYDATVYRTAAGATVGYHQWVRATLAQTNVDPVEDFREQVRALCRDVADRVDAVDIAMGVGTHTRPHPGVLPENIYGTEGDWEMYSTPSRDARLKASFRELREFVAALPDAAARAPVLRRAWQEEAARAECRFAYRNSAGAQVLFTVDTVLDRLYTLSFDPYHCPELRWGARPGTPEMASCPADPVKQTWYANEARLRNRIDREYGVPTPLESGPVSPPDVDVRRLLDTLIAHPPAAPAAPPQPTASR